MKPSILILYAGVLLAGILGPVLAPNYSSQMAMLWVMILFALTWDILGGQTGYNSLGNIVFFGAGMYASAIVQIAMFYDVGKYTAAFGAIKVSFTTSQYFTGLVLGMIVAALVAVVLAAAVALMDIEVSDWTYMRVDLSRNARNTLDPATLASIDAVESDVVVETFLRPRASP